MHFKRELVGRFEPNNTVQVVNKLITRKMEETGYVNVLTRYIDEEGNETFDLHKAQSIYVSVGE